MNENEKRRMEDALYLAVAAYIEAKERPESQTSIDIRYIALKDTFADVNAYRKRCWEEQQKRGAGQSV